MVYLGNTIRARYPHARRKTEKPAAKRYQIVPSEEPTTR